MNKNFKSFLISLPSSKSLGYQWNYGSMLGMSLVFQLVTGVILSINYSSGTPFESVQYIMYECNGGWLFRSMHANGASLFFIFIYFHVAKGIYFVSSRLNKVWASGVVMLLLFMGISFLGYVLLWSQMSYWASVVITSLLSVIPIWGWSIIFWVWGGFSVTINTVKLFFVLHFLLPWAMLLFIVLHMMFLHETGSSSLLYTHSGESKLSFYSLYFYKDIFNVIFFIAFAMFVFISPYFFSDFENYEESNILMSPAHIVPEWYFLFAYAILRSIPNKMLGVILMFVSIMFLVIMFYPSSNYLSSVKIISFLSYMFFINFVFLSFIGGMPVEEPYIVCGQISSFLYFFIIIMMSFNTTLVNITYQ
uniref:Cytochrome b n=1 Tax=Ruizia karukerae TaxID=2201929 RepID=A0A343YNA7_9BILA|nr:cytochrome b [Ruizia karukerae]